MENICFPISWNRCMSYIEAAVLSDLISAKKAAKEEPFALFYDLATKHATSRKTISDILKRLKQKELITFERKGIPSRNYYTINGTGLLILDRATACCMAEGERSIKEWEEVDFKVSDFMEYLEEGEE